MSYITAYVHKKNLKKGKKRKTEPFIQPEKFKKKRKKKDVKKQQSLHNRCCLISIYVSLFWNLSTLSIDTSNIKKKQKKLFPYFHFSICLFIFRGFYFVLVCFFLFSPFLLSGSLSFLFSCLSIFFIYIYLKKRRRNWIIISIFYRYLSICISPNLSVFASSLFFIVFIFFYFASFLHFYLFLYFLSTWFMIRKKINCSD